VRRRAVVLVVHCNSTIQEEAPSASLAAIPLKGVAIGLGGCGNWPGRRRQDPWKYVWAGFLVLAKLSALAYADNARISRKWRVIAENFDILDISMFLLANNPSALAVAAGAISAAVLWIDFLPPDLHG
jgi:hypothetical protein